jgi:signal transduction histidine kinase
MTENAHHVHPPPPPDAGRPRRGLDAGKRSEFYGVMMEDTNRLLETVEQVLRTGQAGRTPLHLERQTWPRWHRSASPSRDPASPARLGPHTSSSHQRCRSPGDRNELRGAIVNLLDNAVKFSVST